MNKKLDEYMNTLVSIKDTLKGFKSEDFDYYEVVIDKVIQILHMVKDLDLSNWYYRLKRIMNSELIDK
jgi:hypothetical protein